MANNANIVSQTIESVRLRAEEITNKLESAKSRLVELKNDLDSYGRLLPARRSEIMKESVAVALKRKSVEFERNQLRNIAEELKNTGAEFQRSKNEYSLLCETYAKFCEQFVADCSPFEEETFKRENLVNKTKSKLSAELRTLESEVRPFVEAETEIAALSERLSSMKADISVAKKILSKQLEELRKAEMSIVCAQNVRDQVAYVPETDVTFLKLRRKIDTLRESSMETFCSALEEEKRRLLAEFERKRQDEDDDNDDENFVPAERYDGYDASPDLSTKSVAPNPYPEANVVSVRQFAESRNRKRSKKAATFRFQCVSSKKRRFVDAPPLNPDQTKITSYMYGDSSMLYDNSNYDDT